MPFTQTQFLGASVRGFSGTVGFNEQQGQCQIALVEDNKVGDVFAPPDVGTACYFDFGDFEYGGLLQSPEQHEGTDGKPVYTVVLVDPREVLQGAQLIIDGYSGTVNNTPNLFNVFGYHESLGFGQAGVNEAGMPWHKILSALAAMFAPTLSIYGLTSLRLRDQQFKIDVSELPAVPTYYRIGGTSISLLDAITQVCNDAGYDYFIRLENRAGVNTIVIKTVSRRAQPTLGKIEQFVTAVSGAQVKSFGKELRNEVTSTFLVGGNVQALYQQAQSTASGIEEFNTIWPFWGFDADGDVVIGAGDFNSNSHAFTLDSRTVNVLGVGDTYDTDVGEMRAAIAGEDEWRSYVELNYPTKAGAIGITGNFAIAEQAMRLIFQGPGINPFGPDIINQALSHVVGISDRGTDWNEDAAQLNVHRLYEFVKAFADEYYGKKFMVRIPFVTVATEAETNNTILSQEPCDGGWAEEGSSPLGLPTVYEDLFSTQDGKFECFVRVNNANNYDLAQVNPGDGVVTSGNTLYLRAALDPYVAFIDQSALTNPRVVITLPSPIRRLPQEHEDFLPFLAGIQDMITKRARQLNLISSTGVLSTNQLMTAMSGINLGAGGFNYFGMEQTNIIPEFAAIPLRSNILTYGPWSSAGATGVVRFERDESLVPWNYAGFTVMNLVANAKVTENLTNMQIGEMGTVTVPGAPSIDLGDVLISGGPNVTSIDVSFGDNGVTTSYRMRTYTPSFGNFAKYNADRFTRIARSEQQQRRNMRQLFRNTPPKGFTAARRRAFIGNDGSIMFKGKSPHTCVMGTVIAGSGSRKATAVADATYQEGIASLNAHDNNLYKSTALMSSDGLFRPYSCDTGNILIGHFESPTAGATVPTVNELNPFATGVPGSRVKATDIKLATHGNAYPNGSGSDVLQPSHSGWDANTVRGMAHKAPLILSGFGYDTTGKPVPNAADTGGVATEFYSDYRHRPDLWKTGPLDARWDVDRKLWVAGGTTTVLAVVVAHSGSMNNGGAVGWPSNTGTPPNPRPRYVTRNVESLTSSGDMIYTPVGFASGQTPLMSGATDQFVFNIQEGHGDIHTVGVGSPVLLQSLLGRIFFSELPRSFASSYNYTFGGQG